MDKKSFILGMITAFCECVAGGCKRLALSPPMTKADFEMVEKDALSIISRHGLIFYHEENLDIPSEARVDWLLIAGKAETIEAYLALRREGFSPVLSLRPFFDLLSYRPEEAVHTGYDAYLSFFPKG